MKILSEKRNVLMYTVDKDFYSTNLSISIETTFSKFSDSVLVRTPNPGPISKTPSVPDAASAIL